MPFGNSNTLPASTADPELMEHENTYINGYKHAIVMTVKIIFLIMSNAISPGVFFIFLFLAICIFLPPYHNDVSENFLEILLAIITIANPISEFTRLAAVDKP